jgi:GNAT superfamily N-acetyltransferase
MTTTPRLTIFTGRDVAPFLPDFARLCTEVFREWPHLYDGDGGYDPDHLRALAESPRSALIVVHDGDTLVGASACLPMTDAAPEYTEPFLAHGWPAERFFYLAESVLRPAYRGHGLGAAFFALREAHIRAVSSCDFACFYATDRSGDHRSEATGSLDSFWRTQGYALAPDFRCTIRWKEVGQDHESDTPMQVWVKSLSGAALPTR